MLLKVYVELEEFIDQIADRDDATIRRLIQDIICQKDSLYLTEAVLTDMLRLVRPEDGWSKEYNVDLIESAYPQI